MTFFRDTTPGGRVIAVEGAVVDDQTRCRHHHTDRDVVAIQAPCCGRWFPCRSCHDEVSDHPLEPWRVGQRDVEAVLCGVCRTRLTIRAYMESGHACPACGAGFNAGCRDHWPAYFDT